MPWRPPDGEEGMAAGSSFIGVNSIIAGIVVSEVIRYQLGLPGLTTIEKRLYFDAQKLTIFTGE